MKKLRWGVLSTAKIGLEKVIPAMQKGEHCEMAAIASQSLEKAQTAAAQLGIPKTYGSYAELLADAEIDAVYIPLPNHLHVPWTSKALEAGKHGYCEKPMAKTGAEAQAMYDTAQRTGKKLSVQMGTVFSRESRTAKRLIKEGALGRVYYVKTSHYRRRGRVYVDGYATPHFVQKEKSGGGTLVDMAVYHLARMVYLLDNPELETVTASTFQELDMDEKRRQESNYNVEELGTGFVRFEGDITMFVEEAWAAHIDGGEGDRIMGSKGGIRLEPFTFYTDMYGMDADVNFNVEAYERRMQSLGYAIEGYESSQKHFVWGVLNRLEMIDTGAIGLTVARITEAMYQSTEARTEINLRL